MGMLLSVGMLVPISSFSQDTFPVRPAARQIMAWIQQMGAKETLDKALYPNNARFDYVTRQIATGKRDWLLVASKIKPVSDAGSASGINDALASAMKVAPTDVLLLLGDDLDRDDGKSMFCMNLIGIEPEEGVLPYLRAVEKRLVNIRSQAIVWRRDRCVEQIRELIRRETSRP